MLSTSSLKPAEGPVRIIISEPCLAQLHGAEEIRHCDIGEEITVSSVVARAVCGAERGLYMNAADDPTKGRFTATAKALSNIDFRKNAPARTAPQSGFATSLQATELAAIVTQAVVAALRADAAANGGR